MFGLHEMTAEEMTRQRPRTLIVRKLLFKPMLKRNQKLFKNFMEFRGKQGQFTWDASGVKKKIKIKRKMISRENKTI